MALIYKTSGFIGAAVMLSGWSAFAAVTLPQAPTVELVPHQAIYDMKLQRAVAGSNVSDVRGRMVFDFRGSPCAGYTLGTRLVTQIIDREGKAATTDMRSSTWEQAQGGQFRFDSSQYLNQKLSDQVAGLAARGSDVINVVLDKPKKHKLQINGQPMFPTQHSLAILEAAKTGRGVVRANVYDGSESGSKLLETTTVIGNPLPPGANKAFAPVKNGENLDNIVSWPVSISYFDATKPTRSDEGLPSYELSFRLYANGVSRKLAIDYGNFVIDGELNSIEFFEPTKCPVTDGERGGEAASRKEKRRR